MFKREILYHDDVQLQTTVPSYLILQFLRYGQHKILKVKVTTVRSNIKSRSHHTPSQCPYQVSTSYTFEFRFLKYSLDNILNVKVTTAVSKVKSRSHHDITKLHPPPPPSHTHTHTHNVPTTYQLPTPYGFRDIVTKKIL